MSWNSPSSVAIDFVFGVLPALFCGFWAAIGCWITGLLFMRQNKADDVDFFIIFCISLSGLLACLSLIYVTFARENTRSKVLHTIFLVLGIVTSILLLIFPSPVNLVQSLNSFFPYLAISLVLIAAKHIFMLSRASEVQP